MTTQPQQPLSPVEALSRLLAAERIRQAREQQQREAS